MTKAVVAQKVAEKTGLNRKDTMVALEILLEAIKSALKEGQKVSLVGFGTFYVKQKGARNGRNPRTAQRIFIPAKTVAMFKPGKAFREMVNRAQPKASPATSGGPAGSPPEAADRERTDAGSASDRPKRLEPSSAGSAEA